MEFLLSLDLDNMQRMDMTSKQIDILSRWHEALNNEDIKTLKSLVAADVKIGGPRGTGQGMHLFLEWIERANITLQPLRFFEKENLVLVEELGQWHSHDRSEIVGESKVYSIFEIENDQISSIIRYDDRTSAFAYAGLNEDHEVGR